MALSFPLLNLRMQLELHCLGERGGMGAAHGPLQPCENYYNSLKLGQGYLVAWHQCRSPGLNVWN